MFVSLVSPLDFTIEMSNCVLQAIRETGIVEHNAHSLLLDRIHNLINVRNAMSVYPKRLRNSKNSLHWIYSKQY